MRLFLVGFTVVFILIFSVSCFDEEFTDDSSAKLEFSADTVAFDTVFTTIGSTTKQLRVINPYNKYLNISQIYLGGGENSFFRLNVDGEKARSVSNIEIAPKDSIYIFIEVTVDPLGVNNPLVINDSIIFVTNGNVQDINLVAYGQDVHLIDGQVIETETWIADKPYLIYNSMLIDSGHTLTIEPGATLYFHKNSYLYVIGTIIAGGTKENPILFRGDRLDNIFPGFPYDKLPNQWEGIFIYPTSTGNIFNYCHIKNGTFGIFAAGDLSGNYMAEITINNSILENFSYGALLLYNATITMQNSLIANASTYLLGVPAGGDLSIRNCTFANYFYHSNSFKRKGEPSVLISNQFYTISPFTKKDTLVTSHLKKADFENCIVYGLYENELYLFDNKVKDFNYRFNHCLLKVAKDSVDHQNTERFTEVIFNEDPKFKKIALSDDYFTSEYYFNFTLDTLSPAKDKGDPSIITTYPGLESDMLGNSRLIDAGPDIGAYERVE
ncbi:MAG: right-handed parallel beta-helix repeat-containing protein [Bacteroidales bacterium]